jgi:hypothetical protein
MKLSVMVPADQWVAAAEPRVDQVASPVAEIQVLKIYSVAEIYQTSLVASLVVVDVSADRVKAPT